MADQTSSSDSMYRVAYDLTLLILRTVDTNKGKSKEEILSLFKECRSAVVLGK